MCPRANATGMAATDVLGRLRQPEYTGENRCIPCTAANTALAVALAAAVGYGWTTLVGAGWMGATLTVLAVSLASIWLRGYLVPGTPELTKRYFPDWLLAYFDKAPERYGAEAEPVSEDIDPERLLLDAGVVEPCAREDDLCLAADFREAWNDRIVELRESGAERDALADQLDIDREALRFQDHGDGFVAFLDGRRAGQWESRAALLADLAGAGVLSDWLNGWESMDIGARSQVLGGLRIFLEACPVCDGPVLAGTETVESCCRSHEVVAAACDDCGARLLEVPYREEATPS